MEIGRGRMGGLLGWFIEIIFFVLLMVLGVICVGFM